MSRRRDVNNVKKFGSNALSVEKSGVYNSTKKTTTRKRKKNFVDDNESIASSDEEFAEQVNDVDISEEEAETAQEKRLRLAKKYLTEIEEEGKSFINI